MAVNLKKIILIKKNINHVSICVYHALYLHLLAIAPVVKQVFRDNTNKNQDYRRLNTV